MLFIGLKLTKWVLLFTGLAILVSCSSIEPPPQSTLTWQQTPVRAIDTPLALWITPIAEATVHPATAVPLKWKVEIVQNGHPVANKNGAVTLHRQPFSIRMQLSRAVVVRLSVLDSDDNFRKVQPGSYANDNCQHAWHTFCSFAGMSIVEDDANMDERLYIDTVSQEGHHILTYDGNSSHGWNTAEITANGIILERNVTRLSIYNMSGTASIPVQDYSGRLYLLFLVKYRPEIVISEDELKKILIIFEEQ